ncbi:class I SAM-dependent methyltransferase [Luteimonas changyuni]|uniref:class I SAM-dependent methyltransferase n=1 Tax=Luteimonas sp. MJ145 TaxID=3129234 RepID=UPI0031BA67A4
MSTRGGGFDTAYFPRLAALEAGNFWFRARNRLLLRLLDRHGGSVRDYLEVGCGTGFVLSAVAARFPGWQVTGSEYLPGSLQFAGQRVPRAGLLRLDARALPFTAAFDAIGAYDVLEHIDDDLLALRSLRQALRPGGIVVLSVPQHPWLWSRQDDAAHHVRRYARGELEGKLRETGFEPAWSSSFTALLLPLMALSRLRPQRADAEHDALAELALPRPLDAAFECVMRAEEALHAIGLRFPAGGSRVVVARRGEPR